MANSVIERNGRVMLLAYDQGFEHGPTDFDERSVDPEFVLKLAGLGMYTGVILQEGIAAKYYTGGQLPPLVVKLNGKTSFQEGEPISRQLCTVEKAVELGAKAVGYTIYVGSQHEEEMMAEFSLIEDEAHKKGLAVIAWMYPRGKKVEGREHDKDVLAYAARLGLELNADYVKTLYTGDAESFRWVVESAGKTKVLLSGGKKLDWPGVRAEIMGALDAGAAGVAIGRNIWQSEDPTEMSRKVGELIFGKI